MKYSYYLYCVLICGNRNVDVGLRVQYGANRDLNMYVRKMSALTLMPEARVRSTFENFLETI
jgi:hypothetical protein